MGIISNFLGALPSIVSGGSQLAGAVSGIKTNDLNYRLQQENLAYQKMLQQTVFNREDNAVQRRVADLKKAGLSPTLAAGSAASAGSVIGTSASRKESNLENLMAIANVKSVIAQQEKAQTEADIAKNQLVQDRMNTAYYRRQGVSPVESQFGWQQLVTNLVNGLVNKAGTSLASSVGEELGNFVNKAGDVSNSAGNTITNSQAAILKQKGLYKSFLKNGFTPEVQKALRGK